MVKQALKDINNIKGEILTINQKSEKASIKSLKRASINRDILQDNLVRENKESVKKIASNK
jgi:hypothetical protein